MRLKPRTAIFLPLALAACSASPQTSEIVGATESPLVAETITCTATVTRQLLTGPPTSVVVATAIDPNVTAQRLPDIVKHDPLTNTVGGIRLQSPLFSYGWGIMTLGAAPMAIDFRTPSRFAPRPQTAQLPATGDTYVTEGPPNENEGSLPILQVREAGRNRALVRFDQSSTASFSGLASATVDLTIASTGANWGSSGRTIAIHRLTRDWVEGQATWNCPSDSNVTNSRPDCDGAGWEMGGNDAHPWVTTPTATAIITSAQTGTVDFDVTADAVFFRAHPELNFGWIIKKVDEDAPGLIQFASRETATPPLLSVTSTGPDPYDPWGPNYSATVLLRRSLGATSPFAATGTVTGNRFNFSWGTMTSWMTPNVPFGTSIDVGVVTCTGSTPVLPIPPP